MPVPHWNWPGLHLNSATSRTHTHTHVSEKQKKQSNEQTKQQHVSMLSQRNGTIQSGLITHGSPRAHRSDRHSRLRCHTSTRRECICHFYKQTVETETGEGFFFANFKCLYTRNYIKKYDSRNHTPRNRQSNTNHQGQLYFTVILLCDKIYQAGCKI